MKKIINNSERFEQETIEGIIAAYGNRVQVLEDNWRVLVSKYPARSHKVGIVTAGGSGHLPVFLGYVGEGMLDACTVGNVFASPSAQAMFESIRAADRGSGVLCLYGNYGGDKLNFGMACDLAGAAGIETCQVLVTDDVASAPMSRADERRGVAGMVFAFKMAGAAAAQGAPLDEVADVARRAVAATKTMGCALSACTVPRAGKPSFSIADDEIEIGMGIHGEPGIETQKMMSANELADKLFAPIQDELQIKAGDECSVLVNGLGATPLEEQFIVFRRVAQLIEECGGTIVMPQVGEYATSMEMAGVSLSIIKLDPQLKSLLLAPARTPFYTNLNLVDVLEFEAPAFRVSNDADFGTKDASGSEGTVVKGSAASSSAVINLLRTGDIDAFALKKRLADIAEIIGAECDYLTELDRQNGDGDLGISMKSGFDAASKALAMDASEDLGTLMLHASGVFNESAPSSLGTILSIGMAGMANCLRGYAGISPKDLAHAFSCGLSSIMEKTGSKPGEKTIIDSLAPGIEALEQTGDLSAAAKAAAAGSEATKEMLARHGRAAYYGGKSLGVLDGGSVVGRLIFEALV